MKGTLKACFYYVAVAVALVVLTGGCNRNRQDADSVVLHDGTQFTFPEVVEFDDRTWRRSENTIHLRDESAFMLFSAGDPDNRLRYYVDTSGGITESILTIETRVGLAGAWRNNGLSISYLRDGSKIHRTEVFGEPSQFVQYFYPNGKLKYEGNFILTDRVGEFRGYYETGELWWIAEYSGNGWMWDSASVFDKNGEPLDVEPMSVIF